jgi:Ca-activated chloride channel homolog
MGSSIGYKTASREITQWCAGLALLLALAGGAISLLWTSRLP